MYSLYISVQVHTTKCFASEFVFLVKISSLMKESTGLSTKAAVQENSWYDPGDTEEEERGGGFNS